MPSPGEILESRNFAFKLLVIVTTRQKGGAKDYIGRSFMTCIPHQIIYYSGNQIKKNVMGGSCGI